VQRTRSSPSALRSPLTRRPLGGHNLSPGRFIVAVGALLAVGLPLQAQNACEPGGTEEVSLGWCDPLVIAGTFGNLHYDFELEKALGMEVRIVPGECGDQASVQFGVGEGSESNWSRLLLVDVVWTSSLWPLHVPWPSLDPNQDTDDFWFTIPPGTGYAGEFYGVVYRDRLDGIFRPAGGEELRVSLPRLCDGESR
jgi:hypothetical protein